MIETIKVEKKQEVLSLISGVSFCNIPSWFGSARRDLKMDLIVPKVREGHAPCPAILWICGGAFIVMDRSAWMPELLRFARAGYVVASMEYRTSNEAQFPDSLIDAKAAVRYLKAHASEFCIDPDRIAVMGESAGGVLATQVALMADCREYDQGDHLEYESSVNAVVDFYGTAISSVESACAEGTIPEWVVKAYIGEDTPERWAKAYAGNYISDKTPPVLILHGKEDSLVSIETSRKFYAALEEKGADASMIEVEGAGHGDDLLYQDVIIEKVLAFLNRVMKK
ncbi:MAG: alpha/beta hydrolase [Ruminococcus flavefaciens]|nr:alpha/beta hydrolase [Ruminococcus flavefaciens]